MIWIIPDNDSNIPRSWRGYLMWCSHHPVCQILYQFVAKFHFLTEGKIIPSFHHGFHQLAKLCLNVDSKYCQIKMTNVPVNMQNELVISHLWLLSLSLHMFLNQAAYFSALCNITIYTECVLTWQTCTNLCKNNKPKSSEFNFIVFYIKKNSLQST